MLVLDAVVRSYAWGSRTALARLRGDAGPSPHPEAELWFGAHPADSAYVHGARPRDGEDAPADGRSSLLDLIESDPAGQLGAEVMARFGPRLPFLLKLLAAEEPLSLQAHPSRDQALEGFDREEGAGIPIDSPIRNYRDRNHKPEVVVALERFDALAGFRDPARTVDLLGAIGVPELDPHLGLLRGQPDEAGLRALFTTWITMPQAMVYRLLPKVLEGCVRYLAEHGNGGEFAAEARSTLQIGEAYPGDVGVLSSMLLNRITLEPGEALYLPAGNLHAYLHGVGVEIMANSDNVLRGGLTPKHVDVPELLRVLDFHSVPATPTEGVATGARERVYLSDTPEFRLSSIDLHDGCVEISGSGPEILLCTGGAVEAHCDAVETTIHATQALWVPASSGPVTLTAVPHERGPLAHVPQDPGAGAAGGTGAQVFRARVGSA
ncbi:mannose-6-phosphate isomerase, class I [Tomitella fengzijianii]|uniref:mannose-6-phosphate isomerase n=1 Tax=Tomitella fengzijianii TaxID=2597660 RepID=A0A516X151_9ACTN|nr:mannose-6-phosphate isomerase, class I [Tomitella fengzijianii]QDQ96798.1 mannose-6-phosphate isomerase, class I [Tomitella fengzijianii]